MISLRQVEIEVRPVGREQQLRLRLDHVEGHFERLRFVVSIGWVV